MIFLKLLLNGVLTFYAVTASITDEHSTGLSDDIIPEHYNIKLVPHFNPYGRSNFYGECNVNINILVPTHRINLYSNVQFITEVVLTDNPPRCEGEMIIYQPTKYLYNNETHIVEFLFKNKLLSGRYILNMKFMGIVGENGGFRILSSKESRYTA